MRQTLLIIHVIVNVILILDKGSITLAVAGCNLNLNNVTSPMVIHPGKDEFLYPKDGETVLSFPSGELLELVCPGGKVDVQSATYNSAIKASCVSGNKLQIDGKNIDWSQIHCNSPVYRTAKKSGKNCEKNGNEVLIGFETSDIFLTVFSVCFDPANQQALYSLVSIPPSINQKIKNCPRPSWLSCPNIFDITSPDSYYVRSHQMKTVNSLLGLPEDSEKYIKKTTDYYLSRGHMTAKADVFYPAQQNVTFFLINVAPQWQTNNDGNWKNVEESVRDYAEAHNVELLQWTGVYGITTLPHASTENPVELYLYNVNGRKALPVPEFYWKVVYEPKSQKGLAIITINNPYLATYKPVCDDVTAKVKWIKWAPDNQVKGFGYTCTIDDLRKVVEYIPKSFSVKDILT